MRLIYKRVFLPVLFVSVAMVAGLSQTSDDSKKSDAVKKTEPNKRGWLGVMKDGAKDGASSAVKDHPIEVTAHEDGRTAEDVGKEIGNKVVRGNGSTAPTGARQNAATPASADGHCPDYMADGKMQPGRHIVMNGVVQDDLCVSGSWMDEIKRVKSEKALRPTVTRNQEPVVVQDGKGLNADGSCGGQSAAIVRRMMKYDSTYECVDGQMMNAAATKFQKDHPNITTK
jgi:hypothetical protein